MAADCWKTPQGLLIHDVFSEVITRLPVGKHLSGL